MILPQGLLPETYKPSSHPISEGYWLFCLKGCCTQSLRKSPVNRTVSQALQVAAEIEAGACALKESVHAQVDFKALGLGGVGGGVKNTGFQGSPNGQEHVTKATSPKGYDLSARSPT